MALRREFVLPDFSVLRAALMIERYLDTLHRNTAPNRKADSASTGEKLPCAGGKSKIISPILRDIKNRGSAYIESVNGDIEELRRKRSRSKASGEMSVHIFAWTRLAKPTKGKAGLIAQAMLWPSAVNRNA